MSRKKGEKEGKDRKKGERERDHAYIQMLSGLYAGLAGTTRGTFIAAGME